MNSLSRRKFLKISGATIATAAVIAGSAKTIVSAAENYSKKKGLEIIPSLLRFMFLEMRVVSLCKRW